MRTVCSTKNAATARTAFSSAREHTIQTAPGRIKCLTPRPKSALTNRRSPFQVIVKRTKNASRSGRPSALSIGGRLAAQPRRISAHQQRHVS